MIIHTASSFELFHTGIQALDARHSQPVEIDQVDLLAAWCELISHRRLHVLGHRANVLLAVEVSRVFLVLPLRDWNLSNHAQCCLWVKLSNAFFDIHVRSGSASYTGDGIREDFVQIHPTSFLIIVTSLSKQIQLTRIHMPLDQVVVIANAVAIASSAFTKGRVTDLAFFVHDFAVFANIEAAAEQAGEFFSMLFTFVTSRLCKVLSTQRVALEALLHNVPCQCTFLITAEVFIPGQRAKESICFVGHVLLGVGRNNGLLDVRSQFAVGGELIALVVVDRKPNAFILSACDL